MNIYPGTRGNAGATSGNVVIYDSETTPNQLVHVDELLVSIQNTQQIDFSASSTVDFTGTSAIVMDGGSVTIKALDQASTSGGASSVTAGKTTASGSDGGGDASVVGGARVRTAPPLGWGEMYLLLAASRSLKLEDLFPFYLELVPQLPVGPYLSKLVMQAI